MFFTCKEMFFTWNLIDFSRYFIQEHLLFGKRNLELIEWVDSYFQLKFIYNVCGIVWFPWNPTQSNPKVNSRCVEMSFEYRTLSRSSLKTVGDLVLQLLLLCSEHRNSKHKLAMWLSQLDNLYAQEFKFV